MKPPRKYLLKFQTETIDCNLVDSVILLQDCQRRAEFHFLSQQYFWMKAVTTHLWLVCFLNQNRLIKQASSNITVAPARICLFNNSAEQLEKHFPFLFTAVLQTDFEVSQMAGKTYRWQQKKIHSTKSIPPTLTALQQLSSTAVYEFLCSTQNLLHGAFFVCKAAQALSAFHLCTRVVDSRH